jgi:hypothetical protein
VGLAMAGDVRYEKLLLGKKLKDKKNETQQRS